MGMNNDSFNILDIESDMAHAGKHNFEELNFLISCFRTFVLS